MYLQILSKSNIFFDKWYKRLLLLLFHYKGVCIHIIITFLFSDVTYGRHHRRNANRLDILPKGPHTFPIGKNSFFTCRAHVHNPELVKNLEWLAPNGRKIPQDDR